MRSIDSDGNVIRDYEYELELAELAPARADAKADVRRPFSPRCARDVWADATRCAPQSRKEAMPRPRRQRSDHASVLLGRFIRIEQIAFFNRDHNGRSSRYHGKPAFPPRQQAVGLPRRRSAPGSGGTEAQGQNRVPRMARVMQEYYRAAARTPMTLSARTKCHGGLARYTLLHTPKLVRDLIIAAEQFTNTIVRRVNRQSGSCPEQCVCHAGAIDATHV